VTPPKSGIATTVSVLAGTPAKLTGGPYPEGIFSLSAIELYPDTLTQGDPFPYELVMYNAGGTTGDALFFPPDFGLSADLNIFASFPALGESGNLEASVYGGGCAEATQETLYVDVLECYEDETPDFAIPETFPYEFDGNTLILNLVITPQSLFGLLDEEYGAIAEALFESDLQILFVFTKVGEI